VNHESKLSPEDKLEIIRLINTYGQSRTNTFGPDGMVRRSAFHRMQAAAPASDIRFRNVVGAAGGVEKREVEAGLSNWEDTEILSGLKEGETVLIPPPPGTEPPPWMSGGKNSKNTKSGKAEQNNRNRRRMMMQFRGK